MPKENKRKRLTFKEKSQLVREVKAGALKKYVIQKYGISERLYRQVLSRENDMNNKGESYEYQNKKSSRTCIHVVLDAVIFEWYKQARDRGDPVSGPIIQEKARILDEKLNGSQTFKASNGWLYCFKNRYGIRLKEEKSSSDPSGAAEFSPILTKKIESENLKLDNIYNADESGIRWQLLTGCTLHLHLEEEEALEREDCKDRVTALFCANASGSHRIPLLLIGNSETPTCLENLIIQNSEDQRFKNLESLGVIYTHQDSAWMDKSIFLLWYKDVFIHRVLERQRQDAITGKVVLLLDNAPCHLSLDELNAINENFEVIYLPPNVPASNQPMAQGLIATAKKLCKKELLRRLLLSEESEGPVEFLKELDLPDCFGMLSLAWDSLETTTLQKAWKLLLGDLLLRQSFPRQEANIKQEEDPLFIDDAVLSERDSPTDLISFSREICDQVSELLSGTAHSIEKSREYLLKWWEYDDIDCGWESLSDSDIVSLVTARRRESESLNKMKNSENIFKDPNSVNFDPSGRRGTEIVTEIPRSETVLEDPVFVNFVTNGRREPEIIPKIEKNETLLEDPVYVNFVTHGRSEPEIVPKVEKSETVLEDPVLVSLVTPGGRGSEIVTQIERSEIVFEDPVFVNFDTNGRREPEAVSEIVNSDTIFENSGNVNFVTNSRREPEIIPKIENTETVLQDPVQEDPVLVSLVANSGRGSEIKRSDSVLEDPVFVNFVANGRGEPEILPKIENRETVLEDPVFDNFLTNGGRGSEIANSATVLEKPESMDITSSSEAFGYLMKFKNWAKSRRDCLPKYLDYIKELESWATEPTVCSWT